MNIINLHITQWIKKIALVAGGLFISVLAIAQVDPTDSLPPDPGGLKISKIQNLNFGAFSVGNAGGTVIIQNNGSRTVTGDVVALNMGALYFQAIFDVDGPNGAIVSITNGSDVVLAGSNGGTLLMHIGSSAPSSPFIITVVQPSVTAVNIGGTLTAGPPAANPPGIYSANFYVTFNLE
jgi:hypothetical protein